MRLTKPQMLIYNMENYAGAGIATLCGSVLWKGIREISELHQAVNIVYKINSALRTEIIETKNEVIQKTNDYSEVDIETLHFSDKTQLNDYAENYAKIPISYTDNLCEIKTVILPDRYGVLIKIHHMIADAWSFSLLATQFNAILSGNIPEAVSYDEYCEKELDYLQSKKREKDGAYFLNQFKKHSEVIYLSEKKDNSLAAERKTFELSREESQKIAAYAETRKTSPYVLLMTAFSVYMSRIKQNSEKFYIGTTVLNRSGAREKNTVGMFINTVPVLTELNNEKSFKDNLSALETAVFSMFRHQKYNYGDILSDIREEYGFKERLYDVLFSYQNARNGSDTESEWYCCGSQVESLQIHVEDRDGEGTYKLHYDYQTDKFEAEEIEKLHRHLCVLLNDAMEQDEKKLYELAILTPEERHTLLYEFNKTSVEYPHEKCVHQLFEEQAEKTPGTEAIIASDRPLTYRELNEQANRIAHSLTERGVGSGDIIAFALPRRSYLIATMLGILKTGAAYMPVDPDYPKERIEYMLADSHAKLYITEELLHELLQNENIRNPQTDISSDSLCYCIYTSGSTGKPKGTLLTHRNVVNYITASRYNLVQHRIVEDGNQRILSVTTAGFDIFVTESLFPLVNGLTVVLANEEQSRNQTALCELLLQHPADVIQTTPTKMRALSADQTQTEYLSKFRKIILGGEALDGELVQALRGKTKAEIFNNYGPTETTVWSSNALIKDASDITIGRPMSNTQIYIVDQYMNLLPAGVTGELCIAGDGVGNGYLNRPELTAERFVQNPFGKGKMYKTGDLAYWQKDGRIAYVGRNDFQVKIRGLRVELGEIEKEITGISGIDQCAVVVRKNEEGRQLICAFYTGEQLSPAEIRNQISLALPKYMMPHIFTHIDRMPLTSSGKVNRKTLPEVDLNHISKDTEYAAPVTGLQSVLCRIIGNVLKTSPVGIHNNFFDLGGDSLKAIELITQAQNEGIYIKLQSVFDYPTVQKLAEHLENNNQTDTKYDNADFEAINHYLERNRDFSLIPAKKDMGNLLLTGATGFFGAHILKDYLDHEEGKAYCIVRGISSVDSQSRFKEIFHYYFGEDYDHLLGKRIFILCGDLKKPHFNLAESEYEELLHSVNTVINSVASVKHYGSYQYFYETNVETVKRIAEFANQAKANLIHISTLSICGNGLETDSAKLNKDTFSECDLYVGQTLNNVYIRSKFEAEKYLLEEAVKGLPVNVVRIGNLTNRYSDGQFQKNYESNAFFRRMTGILDVSVYPQSMNGYGLDFTPADLAAHAVILISQHFSSERTVFHLRNSNPLDVEQMAKWFADLGKPIKAVSDEEFLTALNESAADKQSFISLLDQDGNLSLNENIRLTSTATDDYLRAVGFEWGRIERSYLEKYLQFINETENTDGGI